MGVNSWSGEGLFDGRFHILETANGQIKKLGEEGWLQIKEVDSDMKSSLIPHKVRLTLPSLWQGDKVIAQPHLNYGAGLSVEFSPISAL